LVLHNLRFCRAIFVDTVCAPTATSNKRKPDFLIARRLGDAAGDLCCGAFSEVGVIITKAFSVGRGRQMKLNAFGRIARLVRKST